MLEILNQLLVEDGSALTAYTARDYAYDLHHTTS
jgi:hypothetical protein